MFDITMLKYAVAYGKILPLTQVRSDRCPSLDKVG
jgi:hypothetical protein